jgi:hypothetical protein
MMMDSVVTLKTDNNVKGKRSISYYYHYYLYNIVIQIAFAVVVIITQLEANAATASTSLSFEQTQTNKCSGFVPCGNTGTIVFPLEPGHGGHGHG